MARCFRPCQRLFWIKYFVFVVNFLVWVFGLVSLAVGLWANFDNRAPSTLLDRLPVVPALLLVVIGVVSFCVGLFGWLGALRENMCLIRTFCVLSSVLFVGEVVSGIVMFMLMDQIKATITSYLIAAVVTYQDDELVQEFLDYVQQKLECCGGTGYHDWEKNVAFSCSSSSSLLRCSVPLSCCTQPTGIHCGLQVRLNQGAFTGDIIHTSGCTDLILQTFKGRLFHISILAFAIGVFEVLCVIMAIILLHDISIVRHHSVQMLSMTLPAQDTGAAENVHFFPAVTGL